MDVRQDNFYSNFPFMAKGMQGARFFTIDVEMTGVSVDNKPCHNLSIQEYYAKTKAAAERYQIVQVGFTFCRYNEEAAEYQTETFNCSVSPVFPKGGLSGSFNQLLSRNFGISGSSYAFLRENGFQLQQAIDLGIPYLSRDEYVKVFQYCNDQKDNEERIPIDITKLDPEAQEFYKFSCAQIQSIINKSSVQPNGQVAIHNPCGDKMNGLQVRLVYQIVAEYFPGCVVKRVSVGTSKEVMYVRMASSQERAAEAASRRETRLEERDRLVGLQSVFEGLCGGSFASRIRRKWVTNNSTEAKPPFDFDGCQADLHQKCPTLVGHNLFHDLVFIYHTFFGELPASVDEFLGIINSLFPRIVDTKYMYTRDRHSMHADRSLQELHTSYATQQFPIISFDPSMGYTKEHSHQAGYDSFMTANLFIKQTCTLYKQEQHLKPVAESLYIPQRSKNGGDQGTTTNTASSLSTHSSILDLDEDERNVVDSIRRWPALTPDERRSRNVSGTTETSVASTAKAVSPSPPTRQENYSERELHMNPQWDDDFWSVYGNKTRVGSSGVISFI